MAAPRIIPGLGFIEPMQALGGTEATPLLGDWLYEVKFDGYRVVAVKNGRTVELWSRNHNLLNERFPALVAAVAKLSLRHCLIDGEVCALDESGRSSFQRLQNSGETGHPVVYYAFDLLVEGSRNLMSKPILERKARLAELLATAPEPIRSSSFFQENVPEILAEMRRVGAEGAIAKRIDSIYEPGRRSGAWRKIKFERNQEFVVIGYTLPKNSRQYFGALLVAYYRKKRLIFAGRVGTGFNERSLREIYQKLRPLEIEAAPVAEVPVPSGRWRAPGWKVSETRWVHPKLVAQVKFTEWTEDGILRHPSFQGLREDKDAAKVGRED